MTLCNEWTLGKYLDDFRLAKPLPCRSWGCDGCAPKRTQQLVAQATAGEPNRFLTLTVSPDAGDTPEEAHAVLMRAWHLIVKRLRRDPRFQAVQYLWVVEATAAGQPHLHILLRSPFLPQSLISEWMSELARSPIVFIESIKTLKQVANYVAKYVAKAPARFGNSKRYFASREYELDKLENLEARPDSGVKWQLLKKHIREIWQEWSQEGFIGRSDGGDRMKFIQIWGSGP